MNLSVSHPLDSRSPFGTFVPPPPAGGVFPDRGALGKEVSFSMKLICVCRKTSRNAKASPTRGGGIERSEDDGEVVQSSTCVIPLTRKASFVQPLSLAAARQPFSFRHFRATSPGRGSLSWQGSPWQRGFVFDETDLRLLENVTECQSLSLWERCLRSRRRGQGCCQRARHTAIRTLLVRAIVSQRRWSNFTGLALSGADAPAPPKWEPLAKRFRFR